MNRKLQSLLSAIVQDTSWHLFLHCQGVIRRQNPETSWMTGFVRRLHCVWKRDVLADLRLGVS